jgi:two-component system chemotaxis response regulator CheY
MMPLRNEARKTDETGNEITVGRKREGRPRKTMEDTVVKYLIVDDDPACRDLIVGMLSPLGQCDVAIDGAEAVDAFRLALEDGEPYDLICLDIMMPDVDGHEALDRIRKIEAQHGIGGSDGVKVVMATALRDSKHCMRAFREGCESYVTKPIQEQELLEQVHGLLGQVQGELETASSHADEAQAQAAASAVAPRPRYLVVDDDRVCRELVKDMLSPYGDCDMAYDGREAIEAVRLALEEGQPYELICLDIMMPDCNGHDALKGIRRVENEHGLQGLDGVQVIMTTALRDSKHCMQAFREGCESYVTKPVSERELLARMRQLDLLPADEA